MSADEFAHLYHLLGADWQTRSSRLLILVVHDIRTILYSFDRHGAATVATVYSTCSVFKCGLGMGWPSNSWNSVLHSSRTWRSIGVGRLLTFAINDHVSCVCTLVPNVARNIQSLQHHRNTTVFVKSRLVIMMLFHEKNYEIWISLTQLWTLGFYHIHVVMYVDVSYCQNVVMSVCYSVILVGWG